VPKRVFVAFAKEDERQRDLLKGQALNTRSPFEYVDMSVKEPYSSAWRDWVRTRIRGSDGVIPLISKNTANASGQIWEINCAKEERKKILGVWAYSNDAARPAVMAGKTITAWSWQAIANFIDSL
jgi:Thoeris protein ThsB, TIR-like domain